MPEISIPYVTRDQAKSLAISWYNPGHPVKDDQVEYQSDGEGGWHVTLKLSSNVKLHVKADKSVNPED